MKIIKFLGICFLVVLLVALVPLGRDYISLYQIYIDGGGGSSSGGGTYVPPSDEPPSTDTGNDGNEPESPGTDNSYKGVWHTSEHEYHYFEPITCNACGTTFTNGGDFLPMYYDSLIRSSTYMYKFVEGPCPLCYSVNGNFRNEIVEVHCYVNGVCHDCGNLCTHEIYYDTNTSSYYDILAGLRIAAPNHPLLTSDITYQNGESCVVDGRCMLCLCSDYDEIGLMWQQDDFILRTNDGGESFALVKYVGSDAEVTIPSTYEKLGAPVTRICNDAFKGKSVSNITVPSCVTVVDDNAFVGIVGLSEIEFVEGFEFEMQEDLTLSVSDYNGKGGEVVIPSSVGGITVTSIGSFSLTFADITKIEIPETIVSIGMFAFQGNTIKELTLPNSLEHIASNAFSYVDGFESIVLPEGVKIVEATAFYGCSSLKDIYILGQDTVISSDSFSGCDNLTNIYLARASTESDVELAPWGASESVTVTYEYDN